MSAAPMRDETPRDVLRTMIEAIVAAICCSLIIAMIYAGIAGVADVILSLVR